MTLNSAYYATVLFNEHFLSAQPRLYIMPSYPSSFRGIGNSLAFLTFINDNMKTSHPQSPEQFGDIPAGVVLESGNTVHVIMS